MPIIQRLQVFVFCNLPLFLHVYHAELLALIDVDSSRLESEESSKHLRSNHAVFWGIGGPARYGAGLVVIFKVCMSM